MDRTSRMVTVRLPRALLAVYILGAGLVCYGAPASPAAEPPDLETALQKVIAAGDRTASVAAKNDLSRIAHRAARPGAEAERARVSAALARAYAGTDLLEPRSVIAEILSVVGGPEAVPALAGRLTDRGSRESARFALVRIPAPEAARALREALAKEKEPEFRVALINALGAKRDAEALDLLSAELDRAAGENGGRLDETALAAIEALSRIAAAGAKAEKMLALLPAPGGDAEKVRARTRAFDALLVLCQSLLEAGRAEDSGALAAKALVAAAETHERCGAIVALGRSGGPGAVAVVSEALNHADAAVRGAGEEALRGMPAGQLFPALAALMRDPNATPVLRARLVRILKGRREPDAVDVAAAALADGDAGVRAAALSALEGRSEEKAARALLGVIQAGGPAASEGAVGVLARLPGASATRTIIQAVQNASGEKRAALLRALGQRDDPAAAQVLLQAISSATVAERVAAYEGLGNPRSAGALAVMVLLAGLDKEGAERDAAERSLGRLSMPEVTKALVDYTRGKQGETRAALLRILGKREGAEVLDLLLECARDADEAARVAALEGLAGQRDPKVLPVLLEAAESGPEKSRPSAVLGCLRFGRAIEAKDREAALKVYQKALVLAPGRDEKIQALEGLGRLGDPAALGTVKPLLAERDRRLKQAAAAALLPMAVKLGEDRREEALAVLKEALPLAAGSPGARAATEALRKMGVDYDIAREAGFITRWWIVGPFPNPENKMFETDVVDPDKLEVAEGREVKAGDETRNWKQHHTTDAQGIVNLEEAVGRLDGVGAYAYTEVTVPEDRRASFKLGSDDSIVVWLNGKKIHALATSRGVGVDQDNVDTRLAAGVNRILVKVLNNGAQWAFCFRITDRQGSPLRVEQKEK